tara:strand:- start:5476 stop:6036 length:561 start_codon:yes stop_codon:yes gene_type:complete
MKIRSNSKPADQPEAGTHVGRLVGFVDMGHQPGFEWQGKEIPSAYKVRLTYELPNSKTQDDRPHWVHEEVTNSDNEKSKMYARVRTLGGSFDDASTLLGKPCMITLVQNEKGYIKIDGLNGVGGVPAGFPVPELENDMFMFDTEKPDMDVFNNFPEFIQEKLTTNLDYEGSELEKAVLAQEAGADY